MVKKKQSNPSKTAVSSLSFEKRKEKIEKGAKVKKKLKSLYEKVSSGDIKVLNKKILSKPQDKGYTPISAIKTLKSFAQSSGPLVRQVEPRELVRDDRSLYFNKELMEEERSNNKWLG